MFEVSTTGPSSFIDPPFWSTSMHWSKKHSFGTSSSTRAPTYNPGDQPIAHMELGYNFSPLKGGELSRAQSNEVFTYPQSGVMKISQRYVLTTDVYRYIQGPWKKSVIWGIFTKHKDHGSNRWAFCINLFHSMISWLGWPAPIPGTLKARGKT